MSLRVVLSPSIPWWNVLNRVHPKITLAFWVPHHTKNVQSFPFFSLLSPDVSPVSLGYVPISSKMLKKVYFPTFLLNIPNLSFFNFKSWFLLYTSWWGSGQATPHGTILADGFFLVEGNWGPRDSGHAFCLPLNCLKYLDRSLHHEQNY